MSKAYMEALQYLLTAGGEISNLLLESNSADSNPG